MRDHVRELCRAVAATLDDSSVSVNTRCTAAFQQLLQQAVLLHVETRGRMPDCREDTQRAAGELLQLIATRLREGS